VGAVSPLVEVALVVAVLVLLVAVGAVGGRHMPV
jgi:hypothetical protein